MEEERPIFRDIRRYYCHYCGICRSKKSLISSHILSHHQEELKEKNVIEEEGPKTNTCEVCGASFGKPAYLKQHMLSHSSERSFSCTVEDCRSSYQRRDHLNRHLLTHQGKLFKCPVDGCSSEFAFQGNIKRHVNDMHGDDDDNSRISEDTGQPKYICKEAGCGKVFKFASKLRKHEDSHVKLDCVEAMCFEPGCMQHFTNEECLRAHTMSCHQHITCEICGTKQLKKNIKRHLRTHEPDCSAERINCNFEDCPHSFSNKSNLQQHINAVHLGMKPFACPFTGCDMKFSFKHVRDNHEKTHVYVSGDFVESDAQFRSKPRGGRKRVCPTIEMLLRKRVMLPNLSHDVTNQEDQSSSQFPSV